MTYCAVVVDSSLILFKCFLRASRKWTVRGPKINVCMISSKMRSTFRNSSEFNCEENKFI